MTEAAETAVQSSSVIGGPVDDYLASCRAKGDKYRMVLLSPALAKRERRYVERSRPADATSGSTSPSGRWWATRSTFGDAPSCRRSRH